MWSRFFNINTAMASRATKLLDSLLFLIHSHRFIIINIVINDDMRSTAFQLLNIELAWKKVMVIILSLC